MITECEIGHYYKRTYNNGCQTIFVVLEIDTLYIFIKVIKHVDRDYATNNLYTTHICNNHSHSKTIELTEAVILAIQL